MPDARDVRFRIGRTLLGNFVGAVLTFFYFRYIDPHAAEIGPSPAVPEFAFFVFGFALLGTIGYVLSRRWAAPLMDPGQRPSPLARRRAFLLPYAVAAITLIGWGLAGILWGIVQPLIFGTFSPKRAVRLIFGITGIGGIVTTAFVFFIGEYRWRKILPAFFLDADVSAVRGTPRLGVRLRLLIVFLLVGLIPISLLGVLSYTSATALVGADHATANAIVAGLVPVILFVLAVGVATAIGLSTFVASSVATPLGEVERAMTEVERGNLDHRCPVVANDEIGAVAEGFNRMVHGLREREWIKETFGKYVTREIRDEILGGRISLDGQAVEATILFADLRDFTPWVESTDPREVLRDLNGYFTEMEQAIASHGGLVLQYIGDEIEAVFGAPVPAPDHPARAVRAALEMRRRLAAWNAVRERAGKRPLRNGIGIHTGTVLVGNVGSVNRLTYSLVGDSVNLASRIQGLTKEVGGDILVSGTTRARLEAGIALDAFPAVRVKGRSAEVEVYRLL